ncbi:MAG: mevalonate kinase [Bacteroidota bacterium]
MNKRKETFYAKILLFGEYSILCNSMGLTVPYIHFKGELSFINEDKYTDYNYAVHSNQMLGDFHSWLTGDGFHKNYSSLLKLEMLEQDIRNGLYFDSTIPQGYGIGSSGALVAATYAWYATDRIPNTSRITKNQIQKLLSLFSYMEAFFHGQSSGIDPLNCYIKHPLLIKSRNDISIVGIPRNEQDNNGAIFLINTGKTGKTGPLVNKFIQNLKQPEFENSILKELIPVNNECIRSIIKGDIVSLFKNLKLLSAFSLNNFKEMIPRGIENVWKQGLDSDTFYLKLCGSGGGGFILGFTKNYNVTFNQLSALQIEMIPVYMSSHRN